MVNVCVRCGKKYSEKASSCPHCLNKIPGNNGKLYTPLINTDWRSTLSSFREALLTLSTVGGYLLLFAILLSPAGIFIHWIFSDPVPDTPQEIAASLEWECNHAISAFVFSQLYVKNNLKSPQSAEFPYIGDNGVTTVNMGDCKHGIVAYVDAQNSYGANIRTKYAAVVQYDKTSEKWRGVELEM